jgi:copper transport protein
MAWQRADVLPWALKSFSSAAVPIVALLALAGLVLAIIQLESFAALTETRYGVILPIKLALVAGLLALAALNRFRFAPMVARDYCNTRPLLRSVLLECVLALGILAVVAGWRFTPPPRLLATAIEAPLAVHIHADAAIFQVLISPGRVGSDSFVLQLMNGDASPLAAKEATLTLRPARARHRADRAHRHARSRRLLACARCAAAISRPLAHADRCAGHRFPEGHAGG